jgi:hypothetical protein
MTTTPLAPPISPDWLEALSRLIFVLQDPRHPGKGRQINALAAYADVIAHDM